MLALAALGLLPFVLGVGRTEPTGQTGRTLRRKLQHVRLNQAGERGGRVVWGHCMQATPPDRPH